MVVHNNLGPILYFVNPKKACQHIKNGGLKFLSLAGKVEVAQIKNWVEHYVEHAKEKNFDSKTWNQLLKLNRFCLSTLGLSNRSRTISFRGSPLKIDPLFEKFLIQRSLSLEQLLSKFSLETCQLFFDCLFSTMKEEPSPSTNLDDYFQVCECAEICFLLDLSFLENNCWRKLRNNDSFKILAEDRFLKQLNQMTFPFLSKLAVKLEMGRLLDQCLTFFKAVYSDIVRMEKQADGKFLVEGRWEKSGDDRLWTFLRDFSRSPFWTRAKVNFMYSKHSMYDESLPTSPSDKIGNVYVSPFIRLLPKELTHLDLHEYKDLRDEELAYLLQKCPKITHLTIGLTKLSEAGWLAIKCLQDLRYFKIIVDEKNHMTQVNLAKILPHCSLLKTIDIEIPHYLLGHRSANQLLKNLTSEGVEVSVKMTSIGNETTRQEYGFTEYGESFNGFTAISQLPRTMANDLVFLSKISTRLKQLSFFPAVQLRMQVDLCAHHFDGPLRFSEGEQFPVLNSLTIYRKYSWIKNGHPFTAQDLHALLKVCPALTEVCIFMDGGQQEELETLKVILETKPSLNQITIHRSSGSSTKIYAKSDD